MINMFLFVNTTDSNKIFLALLDKKSETLVKKKISAKYQQSEKLLNEINKIEPFGPGNPYPIFGLRDVKVLKMSCVGARGDHLKLNVSKNGKSHLEAMGWGMGKICDEINKSNFIDIAVQIEANTWNGYKTTQLNIIDIKPLFTSGK